MACRRAPSKHEASLAILLYFTMYSSRNFFSFVYFI